MYSNKTIYCLNSTAVGDLIAAAPVVKYTIDTYHAVADYRVAVYKDFRDFFPFVPEDKFTEVSEKYSREFSVRYLNAQSNGGNVCKTTPSRMKLTHYASINLMAKILSEIELQYIPLKTTDVSKYGIDFTKCVVMITTYRDKQRTIPAEELLKIAEYVYAKGLIPVYVGKRGAISNWKDHLAISDFECPSFGVDLRDSTSFRELYTIMAQAKAVVGADGGPIHIAFTTQTPVVCGFTTIQPDLRIPYRGIAQTVSVVPNIACNFCESNWNLNFWNFANCPRKMEVAECVKKMTAVKFINALEKLRIFE
jgi:Glycosyltransferase family 9 (heptosyltransferase)